MRGAWSRSWGSRARRWGAAWAAAAWRSATCCGCSSCPTRRSRCWRTGVSAEGHGRALLLAEDHDARRRLARAAAVDGWSVRTAEARARESNTRSGASGDVARQKPTRAGADRQQAERDIADELAGALGAEVRVRAARGGGFRAEISFASAEEALELARRLRPRAVA